MAQEATDQNFNEAVLGHQGIAIVDFWAEWCTPCKALIPIFENLTKKYSDDPRVKFFKLDVDNNPDTQGQYRVLSIPTTIFFKNGEKVDSIVGLKPEQEFDNKIAALLGS